MNYLFERPLLESIDPQALSNFTDIKQISRDLKSGAQTTLNEPFRIAGKTAIYRRSASAPLKFVIKHNLLFQGLALHLGKGKADLDSKTISEVTGQPCSEFDFVHANYPQVLQKSTYDFVFCTYVLNVLPKTQRLMTLQMIAELVKITGTAFISVRSKRESAMKQLYQTAEPYDDGIRTKSGTFQRGFTAEELNEEVAPFFSTVLSLKTPSGFEIVMCSH